MLFYAPLSEFRSKIDVLLLFCVLILLRLRYYSGALFGNYNCNVHLLLQMTDSKFVMLMMTEFLRRVCHSVTARYAGYGIQKACDRNSEIVFMSKRVWTVLGSYEIKCVLSRFETDPIQVMIGLT